MATCNASERRLVRTNTVILASCLGCGVGVGHLVLSSSPFLLREIGGQGTAGLGVAAYFGGVAISALSVAQVMDRRGRVQGLTLAFGLGLVAACLMLAAVILRVPALAIVATLLFGVFGAGAGLARAAAADMHAVRSRAMGIGLVLAGGAIAPIAGWWLLGPLLTADLTSSTPWVAAGGGCLAGLVALRAGSFRMAHSPAAPRPTTAHRLTPTVPWAALKAPRVRSVLILSVMSQTMLGIVLSVGPREMVGTGTGVAGAMLILAGLYTGLYGCAAVAGPAIDRVGHRQAVSVGLAAQALLMLGLPSLTYHPAPILSLAAFGAAWGFTHLAITATLSDSGSTRERARLLGFADIANGAATAVAALVAGAAISVGAVGPLVLSVGCTVALLLTATSIRSVIASGGLSGRR